MSEGQNDHRYIHKFASKSVTQTKQTLTDVSITELQFDGGSDRSSRNDNYITHGMLHWLTCVDCAKPAADSLV